MLHAASLADLDFIRLLLREGAAEGSFDRELAGESPEATLFFANLGEALRCGQFLQRDATGHLGEVHVASYVYSTAKGAPSIGYGIFKELGEDGFELWLTGIAAAHRRQGHGRAMLRELFDTPAGQMTCVVRCNRNSGSSKIAAGLFGEFGFALCRETPAVLWLANAKAPPDLVRRIATAPIVAP
jgi:ribosomal protein S18 acetylase RimI-like enzyme